MTAKFRPTRRTTPPRGIILPVVLVIFMLLSMLAISFSFSTRADFSALTAQSQMDQALSAATSGIESAALVLCQKFNDPTYWYDRPDLYFDQAVEVINERQENQNVWRYTLVGYNFDSQEVPRFGITDEASKLNLNTASRDQLRRLPGVTAEMASAILDWREPGDKPRAGGAKDEYYMGLDQPYRCKKSPFDTVEELLLVKGFTGKELFGEDMNRNGILDPNENDGTASLPIDNADGNLDRGLFPFLTVYNKEPEVTDSDPFQPRINLKWDATVLQTMLKGKLRTEIIDFIMKAKQANIELGPSPAYLYGMRLNDQSGSSGQSGQTSGPSGSSSRRNDMFRKSGDNTTDNSTSDNATSDNTTEDEDNTTDSDNDTEDNTTGGAVSPVTLADLDTVMDLLTTGYKVSADGFVYGRININTAPRTVLSTIRRLTDTEIDGILSVRQRLDPQEKKSITWLVKQNVLTPDKFRNVACLFTARSYQFMIEALGYCDKKALQSRVQAVLELRLPRIQYIYWRDLTSLGRAYNIGELGEMKIDVKQ